MTSGDVRSSSMNSDLALSQYGQYVLLKMTTLLAAMALCA